MAYDIYEDVDDTTIPASEVRSDEPKSDEKPIEEEKPKTEDKPKPKFSFQTKPINFISWYGLASKTYGSRWLCKV
ncbi:hypothetical protein TVAGG3_0061450, partial [Trichomonas vaginalis G3]|uniref:hypothetical protein n=1 Tax=Trichomonas vaginalis (strain ATCC PRA-98 / G3) TaxID=412133 RepID=UPI0021E60DF9